MNYAMQILRENLITVEGNIKYSKFRLEVDPTSNYQKEKLIEHEKNEQDLKDAIEKLSGVGQ